LYKSGDLVSFFSIPPGNLTSTYTDLSIGINTNDRLTVNVVSGSGTNFTMSLLYNHPN
jgi:hypothetical protein